MTQIVTFTVFALLLARVMRAPRGTWRWILLAALVVAAASQLLPAGNAFRESVRGSAVPLFWIAVALVPVVAYALLLRRLRARTGVSAPPRDAHPTGLVLIAEDEALARDTARALRAEAGTHAVSLGWRDPAGAMAGHARLLLGGDTAELEQLWVAPASRGEGIGGRLLAQAEAEARARGAARLLASAAPPGDAFLTRHGFAAYGRLDGVRSHLVKALA